MRTFAGRCLVCGWMGKTIYHMSKDRKMIHCPICCQDSAIVLPIEYLDFDRWDQNQPITGDEILDLHNKLKNLPEKR